MFHIPVCRINQDVEFLYQPLLKEHGSKSDSFDNIHFVPISETFEGGG